MSGDKKERPGNVFSANFMIRSMIHQRYRLLIGDETMNKEIYINENIWFNTYKRESYNSRKKGSPWKALNPNDKIGLPRSLISLSFLFNAKTLLGMN